MNGSDKNTGPVLEFGLDTFGDVPEDGAGTLLSYAAAIRQVVDEAVLADQLGVDVIALGEHHRPEYAISSPETVLAGIATRTDRIKLASGVTVLSSDDPIRVFQRFATVDALSNGRAQVILGRGSFTESFPLFGHDLRDYDVLFEEKLALFTELRREGPLTWEGTVRPPLTGQRAFPTTERGTIPTWVGVGGSPESVVRAARHGLPMMLAVIGGAPARFAPYADLHRRALAELGHDPQPIGVHAPGFVAGDDATARDLMFGPFKANRDRIGAERGWPPTTRDQFEAEADRGAVFVGSPDTVARRIAETLRVLGAERFDLKYANGPLAHEHLLEAVRLYGAEVAPRVRRLLED